ATASVVAPVLEVDAGLLQLRGAGGGPVELSRTPFQLGINDTLGADPTGQPFDQDAMTLFADWTGLGGNRLDEARAAVARGEALFNRKRIDITGVRGLNDV